MYVRRWFMDTWMELSSPGEWNPFSHRIEREIKKEWKSNDF